MKTTCTRQNLLGGLQVVGNVVPVSSTKAILSDIKIEALGEEIELCATDLEVGVRYRVAGATSEENGAIVVPSHKTTEILRTAPDEKLTLATEEMNLTVTGRDSYFKIHGEDPAQFPPIPEFPSDAEHLEIGKDDFMEMISKTVFATAEERTRYALNGVLMCVSESTCMMVATDGRRLATIHKKCVNAAEYDISVIVPTKALTQIQKIVTKDEETIHIKIDENQILVGTKRATLYAQLVEGQFPDYESVVPSGNTMTLELATEPFESVVSRAGLLATEDSRAVRLSFDNDKLTVTSRNPEQGESQVEMALKYSDEPFEIAFNPDYIGDALKVVGVDAVEMRLSDPKTAAILTDKKDFTYVIMPLDIG